MSKQADTKKTDRRLVPSLLARKYTKDYEASVAEFPEDKKIEFLEHLLECLDIMDVYIASPTKENYKIYANKENAFLKKHGKRLKIYRQTNMYLYYGDHHVLVEKGIYTNDEWNALSREKQKLSSEEFTDFVHLCRNSLYLERDYLWLSQSPEDEKEERNTEETLNGGKNLLIVKRFKEKREAQDKKTCLSQEQTVLLIHYLREEKVLLQDEYLKDIDIGKVFEILTGYSHNTLRQDLGNIQPYQNKINLKELNNLLTRLQIAVGKALKEK